MTFPNELKEAAQHCLKSAQEVKRPCAFQFSHHVILIGVNDIIFFEETDGVIFNILFSLNPEGSILSTRWGKPSEIQEAFDRFVEIAKTQNLIFQRW